MSWNRRQTIFQRILYQERAPVCTAISLLTGVLVEAIIILYVSFTASDGWGQLAALALTVGAVAFGLLVNGCAGVVASDRGEYLGGRIAATGIALWTATVLSIYVIGHFQANQKERARVWGKDGHEVVDVIVQPDRKLVLLGDGMVRILPDGQQDSSFHRDYSFARRGSLPGPFRSYWTTANCAAIAPNGDVILATRGWIGRVRPDGRDAPDLVKGSNAQATCWGLALQADGGVLVGWTYARGGNGFARILPDGRTDPAFHPALAPWFEKGKIAIQSNGKILLAGLMSSVNDFCYTNLARLNVDGSVDADFHLQRPCLSRDEAARGIGRFAVLTDGSMIVTSPLARNNQLSYEVVHADSNGLEIRKSGLRAAIQNLQPRDTISLSDGRILTVGRNVVRLLEDGRQDPTSRVYESPSSVRKFLIQGEQLLVVDALGHLTRLNSDGSVDASFQMPVLKVYSD
jgi:uncharacterized delta-60 repeat protein